MTHFTVSGTSVSDRLYLIRDNIAWGFTRVFLVGGLQVSVPGVVAGTFVPAEGMNRTDTILKNLEHDHTVVWEHTGGGLNNLVQFMETEG